MWSTKSKVGVLYMLFCEEILSLPLESILVIEMHGEAAGSDGLDDVKPRPICDFSGTACTENEELPPCRAALLRGASVLQPPMHLDRQTPDASLFNSSAKTKFDSLSKGLTTSASLISYSC